MATTFDPGAAKKVVKAPEFRVGLDLEIQPVGRLIFALDPELHNDTLRAP
jgi:hypothetical protein